MPVSALAMPGPSEHYIRGMSASDRGLGGAVIDANDRDGQFAYQAIVGVATPLTWLGVTGLTLTA